MARDRKKVRVDSHELSLSSLDKALYPAAGFTKGDVIDYCSRIADVMLPHLKDRPVTLKRYPNGVDEKFFFQKQCPSHRPEWVRTASVPRESTDGTIDYCLVNDRATLIWLANLAALELHVLLAKARDVKSPTMMVFDLDPGAPATLIDCLRIGVRLRTLLRELELQCFPKVSGGKGLHVYVPFNVPTSFAVTKPLAHAIAKLLERDDPANVTSNMRKDLRGGKVFVDWSQNDEHKTTVCVYSLRARERPTVSAPISWDEVEDALREGDARGLFFEARDVLRRVESMGDLFEPVLKLKQKVPEAVMQGISAPRGRAVRSRAGSGRASATRSR